MSQFVIQAKDFSESGTLSKRMNARPFHLQRMKTEKEKGIFLFGGALLNEEGTMIGSLLVVSLPDVEAVKKWIEVDPYKKDGVWNEISILPFRLADV